MPIWDAPLNIGLALADTTNAKVRRTGYTHLLPGILFVLEDTS